jgi:branched-chain amino acid transport system permease protein
MDYVLHLATLIAIYAALTVSLDLLIGHIGLLTFAHAAFYGIGAYTTAILTAYAGWNWFPAMLAAFVMGMIFAAAIGIPTLRLGGDYFILALFGVQLIVVSVIVNWESLTNGSFGIRGVPRPAFFGHRMQSEEEILGFTIVVAGVVFLMCRQLVTSPLRAVMHAIRDDETVALALGVNVVRTRIVIFSLGGGMAGLMGAVYAFYLRFVDVSSFTVNTVILLWAMVFVGGSRSLAGAIVGPIILVLFPEAFRFIDLWGIDLARAQEALYGALLVLLMMFRPQGIVGGKRA